MANVDLLRLKATKNILCDDRNEAFLSQHLPAYKIKESPCPAGFIHFL